jgi:arsenite transporter
MDGLAALLLGLVVIGLMSAIGPGDPQRPARPAARDGGGLRAQHSAADGHEPRARRADPRAAPALGVVAGNRNIALFLSVLPAQTAEELLLFIGCFQVPMYVTPFLLARWYRWTARP